MNTPSNSVINSTVKNPLKRCLQIGDNTAVVIDKTIVKKLRLDEDNTFLEQEITADNYGGGAILMWIRRFG